MKHLILLLASLFFLQLLSAQEWKQVSAGGEFSLGLTTSGYILAWGFNGNGQLGTGNNTQYAKPAVVDISHQYVQISAGGFHSAAIRADGSLWTWGFNEIGQLGLGNKIQQMEPRQVGTTTNWKTVVAGYVNTYAIKTDGSLWAWGWNEYGQVGDTSNVDRTSPVQIGRDRTWKIVAAGGAHALAISNDGKLLGWGFNENGQLGNGSPGINAEFPVVIDSVSAWDTVAGGGEFTIALKENGTLWSCGFNGNGQLGLGDNTERDVLTQIGTENDWQKIAVGSSYAFAMKQNGEWYRWGSNFNGQLGTGTKSDVLAPMSAGASAKWSTVACATTIFVQNQILGSHTLVIDPDHLTTLCATGSNYSNQLGDGTFNDRTSFDCTTRLPNGIKAQTAIIFNVYPNPFYDYLNVKWNDNPGAVLKFKILDLTGKVLKEEKVASWNNKIELSDLPAGMYLIEIQTDTGVYTERVIKQ